ncbi:EpsG family protein [Globicatella sanguinis]
MLYIYLAVIIGGLALISSLTKKEYKKASFVFMIIIMLISGFRYSLGTDYFSYNYIYYSVPSNFHLAMESNVHSEIGFKLIIWAFKFFNFKFEVFVFFMSFSTIGIFSYLIMKHSKLPLLSFFLFTSLYYPIYVNSGIRQGLAMSIVLFAIIEKYQQKKYISFFCLIGIAGSIHLSSLISLIVFLVPIVKNYFINKPINLFIGLLVSIGISIFIILTSFDSVIINNISFLNRYDLYLSGKISWIALANKLITTLVLSFLYFRSQQKTDLIKTLMSFYLIGLLIYLIFVSNPMVSRILDVFIISEIILIPNLVYDTKFLNDKLLLLSLVFPLVFINLFKDIQNFVIQENYFNQKIENYRYFTIFNKDEILEYKVVNNLIYLIVDD